MHGGSGQVPRGGGVLKLGEWMSDGRWRTAAGGADAVGGLRSEWRFGMGDVTGDAALVWEGKMRMGG